LPVGFAFEGAGESVCEFANCHLLIISHMQAGYSETHERNRAHCAYS